MNLASCYRLAEGVAILLGAFRRPGLSLRQPLALFSSFADITDFVSGIDGERLLQEALRDFLESRGLPAKTGETLSQNHGAAGEDGGFSYRRLATWYSLPRNGIHLMAARHEVLAQDLRRSSASNRVRKRYISLLSRDTGGPKRRPGQACVRAARSPWRLFAPALEPAPAAGVARIITS